MGGSEAEVEQGKTNIPKLPLFSPPQMHSPERSGMVTPPLHTSASVPFGWEEEPGKPRPCTALVSFSKSTPKCLELPPRFLVDAKLNKLPSPTTFLLEGPCNSYQSLSFRMSEDCHGYFSAKRGQLGTTILSKGVGIKDNGWFGSWREKAFKVKREVSGGSHVFPSSADKDIDHVGTIGGSHKKVRVRKMKPSGSFSNLFYVKSRVWTTIWEGLKQVVPWRTKKLKKHGWHSEPVSSVAIPLSIARNFCFIIMGQDVQVFKPSLYGVLMDYGSETVLSIQFSQLMPITIEDSANPIYFIAF
ncbi:uncharacterized protein At4g00950 [Gastrolobium bilobum]|uniref:uncharacterized protein At4g00950 n=1 Tax=Gastrolobium bilobum TaxID=150636 RepID=UPI002AB05873|nr:uncharacterized protein At4g00950 [Gastrolobium bilobum]